MADLVQLLGQRQTTPTPVLGVHNPKQRRPPPGPPWDGGRGAAVSNWLLRASGETKRYLGPLPPRP
eukprot:2048844-Prorocentrum_lima.AAC.1